MGQLINWLLDLLSSREQTTVDTSVVTDGLIPEHIAIIMDGNGRWAQDKGYPRSMGHKAGVDNLKEIVEVAYDLGINYITTYAFSTENWKRPQEEVDFLMELFEETFAQELATFQEENIKVNIIGRKDRLPDSVLATAEKLVEMTADNDGLILNVALDYGGRAEIVAATTSLINDIERDNLEVEAITEEQLASRLQTANQPDPDLLIRPGGEQRISNFLIWQLAYTELYFTDVYWPEFNQEELVKAIQEYQRRERRFGGLQEE
ncbi:isoprenyl transferase [Halanaerobaculum tunisiense]